MTHEEQLIDKMVENMLDIRFHSKQEMSDALGIDAAVLESHGSFELLDQLLHYCVKNVLPMESLLNGITT